MIREDEAMMQVSMKNYVDVCINAWNIYDRWLRYGRHSRQRAERVMARTLQCVEHLFRQSIVCYLMISSCHVIVIKHATVPTLLDKAPCAVYLDANEKSSM
jgi:CO dehydrogenase/acetyl-CoA synthase beta subunit